jgi:PilZ domain-containing protein
MSSTPGRAPSGAQNRQRRRRYPRYRCEFPVALTLLSGAQHLHFDAHCRDLSEAGIGVLLAAELAPGEVAKLTFTIPEIARPWLVRAVLRHRRGFHYGFEFLSLSPDEAGALKSYLATRDRADFDE